MGNSAAVFKSFRGNLDITAPTGEVYISMIPNPNYRRDRCVLLFSELLHMEYAVNKSPTQSETDNMSDELRTAFVQSAIMKAPVVIICVSKGTSQNSNQCFEIACAKGLNKDILFVALDSKVTKEALSEVFGTEIPASNWIKTYDIKNIYPTRDKIATYLGDRGMTSDDTKANPEHTLENGDLYWGLMSGENNNEKTGYGRCVYATPAGREYIGDFYGDKRHGSCVVRYPNGNLFCGDYVKEKWHGNGIMVYADGDIYEGEYSNGVRSGKGKIWLKTGDTYTGDFTKDVFEGTGKYGWEDGAYFEGGFVNGLHHGQGKMVESDGTVAYEGLWNAGEEAD